MARRASTGETPAGDIACCGRQTSALSTWLERVSMPARSHSTSTLDSSPRHRLCAARNGRDSTGCGMALKEMPASRNLFWIGLRGATQASATLIESAVEHALQLTGGAARWSLAAERSVLQTWLRLNGRDALTGSIATESRLRMPASDHWPRMWATESRRADPSGVARRLQPSPTGSRRRATLRGYRNTAHGLWLCGPDRSTLREATGEYCGRRRCRTTR